MKSEHRCRHTCRAKSEDGLRRLAQPIAVDEDQQSSLGRGRMAVCLISAVMALVAMCCGANAQPASNPDKTIADTSVADAMRALQEEVRQLQSTVAALRAYSEQGRAETRELRRELEELRGAGREPKAVMMEAVARTASRVAGISDGEYGHADGSESVGSEASDEKKSARGATLDEEYELLSGKVDDQYQTKVESASKYRMRLSGIVLFNMFSSHGTVDSIDLPTLAFPHQAGDSGGSFGATLRQSELGFEVFGPRVAGARTRANIEMDFAGGFATVPNGVSSGFLRLRTATMRMDWENTSVVAGQDGVFFAPTSPTSFASLAEPAFSYAGNLWGWVPQIRVEHRIVLGEGSSLLLQGGILDPLSGELPTAGSYRQADAGELSRQPAYATRVAWTHTVFGQPLRIGAGAFYSRQNYGFQRSLDAWAGTSDVELPLGHWFSVSGEFYRGRGLGGFYGGIGRSALFSANPTLSYAQLIGLNTVGGWAQVKFRPRTKLEFNVAAGMDNPYARDLEYFPNPQSYWNVGWTLTRNQAGLVNMIYRPRSDVLFSTEYRRLNTFSLLSGGSSAGQLNLSMGVLF